MDTLNQILAANVAQGDDTKDKLLGAAFMVVDKNGILYEGSAGRIGVPSDSPPWTPSTISWVASLTKLPSVICLLQAVERGLFGLDDDLRARVKYLGQVELLKGFNDSPSRSSAEPIMEPNTQPITLRTLLTHTSGLCYDLMDEDVMRWRQANGTSDRHNNTWSTEGYSTPLRFAPGSQWQYGTGVEWATMVLEHVTGRSLGEYMEEHVLGPLGMADSGFWPTKQKPSAGGDDQRLARPPLRGPEGELVDAPWPIPIDDHPVESGGAGLFSTASDYAKLLRAVLQGKLLGEESMRLLFQPQLDEPLRKDMMAKVADFPGYAVEYPPGTPANFALGGMVNTEDIPGKRSKGSIMWSGYTNPHWWIDSEKGIAGVLIVSVLPFPDPVVEKIYSELESAVYSDLLA